MLKKLFKTGVTAAAGWVGTKLGGPAGGAFAKKITGSLFDRNGGSGGDFQIQDTSVAPQNYGGRVGFERSDICRSYGKVMFLTLFHDFSFETFAFLMKKLCI